MNEIVMVALLSTVVAGMAGENAAAQLIVHAENATTITVQGVRTELQAGTHIVPVSIPIEIGQRNTHIIVETASVSYLLPLTTVGRRDWSWLWWLLLIPALSTLTAIRLRTSAGSS